MSWLIEKARSLRGITPNIKEVTSEKTQASLKPATNIEELFDAYGVPDAKEVSHIPGDVIDRHIIQLPMGANIKTLTSRLTDLKRDFGQPVTLEESLVGWPGCIAFDTPTKNRRVVEIAPILESKEFKESGAILPLILGRKPDKSIQIKDMTKIAHAIMAGMTRVGKTSGLNSIIKGLTGKVQFALTDLKRVDLVQYNKHHDLYAPIAYEAETAYQLAQKLDAEITARQDLFKAAGVVNIAQYHAKGLTLPYIVHIVDETAMLFNGEKMVVAGKELTRRHWFSLIYRKLIQQGAGFGIHIFLSTQFPSNTAIPRDVKANIPFIICLTTANESDSKYMIGSPKAAYLLGKGDGMIYDEAAGSYTRIHLPLCE